MSAHDFSDRPYSPLGSETPPLAAAPQRPTFLAVVTIVFVVFGVMGAFVAFGGLVSTVFADRLESKLTIRDNSGELTFQSKVNQASYAVLRRYFVPSLLTSGLHLLLSVALVLASIKAFRLLPNHLANICWTLVGFEILRFGWLLFVTSEVNQLQDAVFASANSNHEASGNSSLIKILQISRVITIVFWSVWTLVKVTSFAVSARYLQRDNIRSLFVARSP